MFIYDSDVAIFTRANYQAYNANFSIALLRGHSYPFNLLIYGSDD